MTIKKHEIKSSYMLSFSPPSNPQDHKKGENLMTDSIIGKLILIISTIIIFTSVLIFSCGPSNSYGEWREYQIRPEFDYYLPQLWVQPEPGSELNPWIVYENDRPIREMYYNSYNRSWHIYEWVPEGDRYFRE